MCGPDVATIQVYSESSGIFRLTIVARFLERVGVAAENETEARLVGGPGRNHAGDAIAHPVALAEVGKHELRNLERDEVARVLIEERVPDSSGAAHVAAGPGVQRG